MVIFKKAANKYIRKPVPMCANHRHSLVVIVTNPRSSGYHSDASEGQRDDPPCEDNLLCMLLNVLLEATDDGEHEPCDT